MKVDVIFDFAKVYDINKLDVAKGQSFSLQTDLTAQATQARWFSDNDPVLAMKVSDNGFSADVQATEIGKATILIFGAGFSIIKEIDINVIETIEKPAVTLGLKADAAVTK